MAGKKIIVMKKIKQKSEPKKGEKILRRGEEILQKYPISNGTTKKTSATNNENLSLPRFATIILGGIILLIRYDALITFFPESSGWVAFLLLLAMPFLIIAIIYFVFVIDEKLILWASFFALYSFFLLTFIKNSILGAIFLMAIFFIAIKIIYKKFIKAK